MKLVFDPRLKGIKELDKSLFESKIELPTLKIKKNNYSVARRLLKDYSFDSLISIRRYQDLDENHPLHLSHKVMVLDPDEFKIDSIPDTIKSSLLEILQDSEDKQNKNDLKSYVENIQVDVTYNDVKFDDVLKAILPDDLLNENVNAKGYSIIGHIAHFNLRDKILDYKNLIGQVLLDKVSHIKTVVNKLNAIDSTYRNFEFEILAGSDNTNVETKENGCIFKFDFSKVYWNPRLGFEHERVVNLLNPNDVVYDVFAGVGPFSIPAVSKRRVTSVLANDLNPYSYSYLMENYRFNNKSKTKQKEIELHKAVIMNTKKRPAPVLAGYEDSFKFDPTVCFYGFNLDGRDFIRKKLKYHLVEALNYRQHNGKNIEENDQFGTFYALMNLPAMSVEFLDAFTNLYDFEEEKIIKQNIEAKILENFELNVFCYHFAKTDDVDLPAIKQRITTDIFKDSSLAINSKFVRKVAPSKDMYCSMFKLSFNHFFAQNDQKSNECKLEEKLNVENETNGSYQIAHKAKLEEEINSENSKRLKVE